MSGGPAIDPGRARRHPGAGRFASRWSAVLVVAALVALQAYALVGLLVRAEDSRLHEADLALAAPPVVAEVLADAANEIEGRPFVVHPVADASRARAQVRDGHALAALVLDLRGARDELTVDGSLAPRVRDAVVRQVRNIEAGRGRTVHVRTTTAEVSSARLRAAVLVATGGGFLLGLLLGGTLLLVDVRGARRAVAAALGGCLALGGAAAVVLVPGTSWRDLTVGAVLSGSAMLALLVARALDWLAGQVGLGLGLLAHIVTAVPLLRDIDVVLLPPLWATQVRATPTWAGYELVNAVADHGGSGWLRPTAVLGAWLVAALVGIGVSWRHQLTEAEAGPNGAPNAPADWRWRRRTAAVVSLGLAVVLAGLVLLPRPGVTSVDVADLASETECIATGTVSDLADLNRISAQVRGDGSFQGGDVGADVQLQDGRRLMVFGDTLRGADFPGQQFVRNSMLAFDQECVRTVLPADGGALIPDRRRADGSTIGYWPMSIGRVERAGYDLVAVGAQRVETTGSGTFDFQTLGPAIAVFFVVAGQDPQLLTVRDLGPDDTDPDRPEWGAAATVDEGWLYLYGTANPRQTGVFGFSLRVARVRPDDVLEHKAWRYWDGTEWQPDPEQAQELIPAVGGVSQTLSVFRQGETWYALSKRDEFLGTDLVVWRAPSPWGPFDDGTTVAKLPSDAATGQLRYMPLAHPDLLPEPGTVVVSYSRNRTDLGEIIDDPFDYRPRFLRVELPQ